MRILHYSLGLPPYRTGGLTKYSYDLMTEQQASGNEVFLLFPGIVTKNQNLDIKFYKNSKGVQCYEVINPLPVPLLSGVVNPKRYMQKVNSHVYEKFLKQLNIEVIHVHTLMGLHKELLEAAKALKIRVVYTAHDYYGVCTKVNLLDKNNLICEKRDIKACVQCNVGGFSEKTNALLQSRLYRELKSLGIVAKIKAYAPQKGSRMKSVNKKEPIIDTEADFLMLYAYYKEMFKLFDSVVFNSKLTKDVFNSFLKLDGYTAFVTHKEIKDNRVKKDYSSKTLKLLYMGPSKAYKGFELLLEAMSELENYNDITLEMYGDIDTRMTVANNICIKGSYTYNQLSHIFENVDVLVVPSIWKETFGLIVLEAISHGVPVIVTKNVGSKDILSLDRRNGFIIEPTKESLKEQIIKLYKNKELLADINKNILENDFNYLLSNHLEVIGEIYGS